MHNDYHLNSSAILVTPSEMLKIVAVVGETFFVPIRVANISEKKWEEGCYLGHYYHIEPFPK
jgi:hypothetical protein